MEINDYPNYLIYEDGRVWSKKNKKFIKSYLCPKTNYYKLQLSKNNKSKMFSIHRLLALHYIPNSENKPTVDHIDTNRQNNNLSNLRWATALEQSDNKNVISNTGYKYITKHCNRYKIFKRNCFEKLLNCDKYSLEDAIDCRDYLLSMDSII